MDGFVEALRYLNAAVFTGLAVVSLVAWRRRRTPAGRWAFLTFATLAFVTVAGLVVPDDAEGAAFDWFARFDLVVLLLFPYFLYRFTAVFAGRRRWSDTLCGTLTGVVVAATLALPDLPGPDEQQPWWLVPFLIVALAQWSVILVVVAVSLWRSGYGQPTLARRRMRALSAGAAGMATALLLAGAAGAAEGASEQAVSAVTQILAVASALAFYVGFATPRWLRALWRAREVEATRRAMAQLMGAVTENDVATGLLPHVAAVVGARGSAVILPDGRVLAEHGASHSRVLAALVSPDPGGTYETAEHGDDLVRVPVGDATLAVWTSRYTPFFGRDEIELLRSLGTVAALALDRVAYVKRERDTSERLRQLSDLKNDFVAMVAHDLRSPMSVISGFADTMIARWGQLQDEQKLEYLRLISRNTRNLAAFVEDVLQVARIESGEYSYEMAKFDLRELVNATVADMQMASPGREIQVDVSEPLPAAFGDLQRHRQILTNLISNALKFSPPDEPVEVQLRANSSHLKVTVTDHGVGIKPEDLPRLFQKFSRIDTTQGGRRVPGTGLGLYICKSMIEAQGGTIDVHSEPEHGSTFAYTLPTAERREEGAVS